MEQIEELIGLLGADRVIQGQVRLSDVQAGWRLVTVGARACTDANSALELLQQPKLENGKLWLRFMAWGTTVSLNENAICALKLLRQHFMRASFTLVPAPKLTGGAADAWANETVAGLGGWACFGDRLQWFHLELLELAREHAEGHFIFRAAGTACPALHVSEFGGQTGLHSSLLPPEIRQHAHCRSGS